MRLHPVQYTTTAFLRVAMLRIQTRQLANPKTIVPDTASTRPEAQRHRLIGNAGMLLSETWMHLVKTWTHCANAGRF